MCMCTCTKLNTFTSRVKEEIPTFTHGEGAFSLVAYGFNFW